VRDLALHILDILQNAIEAGATRVILHIAEDPIGDRLTITIRDDGRGMDRVTLSRAVDPFFTSRTTRTVGLGLSLFAAAAERAGGHLRLLSLPGVGTEVGAFFQLSHLDRQPLGNMADTLLAFITSDQSIDFEYRHCTGDNVFQFSTADIRKEVGVEIPLTHPKVQQWLRAFLSEGEKSLQG